MAQGGREMTPKERAKKIVDSCDTLFDDSDYLKFVEDQIREAEEIVAENTTKLLIAGSQMTELGKKVKAEAYEDAANIVHMYYQQAFEIVKAIRARKDEVCK
jgi:hypothetical protein